MSARPVKEIVSFCQEIFDDLDFTKAREWKAARPGRKVIGYMPVYVPRSEIVHAAGMLPLGILGGGADLEVIHGDAYYQSYICRIPRWYHLAVILHDRLYRFPIWQLRACNAVYGCGRRHYGFSAAQYLTSAYFHG